MADENLISNIKALATAVGDGPCTDVYTHPSKIRHQMNGFIAVAARSKEDCPNEDNRDILVYWGETEDLALVELHGALVQHLRMKLLWLETDKEEYEEKLKDVNASIANLNAVIAAHKGP